MILKRSSKVCGLGEVEVNALSRHYHRFKLAMLRFIVIGHDFPQNNDTCIIMGSFFLADIYVKYEICFIFCRRNDIEFLITHL